MYTLCNKQSAFKDKIDPKDIKRVKENIIKNDMPVNSTTLTKCVN